MWVFSSTLSLVVAAISINPFAAAQETSTKYPPQVAQHLDLSVNPCDDFHKFSCGGYYPHPVPVKSDEDDVDYNVRYSLERTRENNHQVLLKLLKSNTPVVSKYFDSCMNTARINERGHQPLQQVLDKIDAVQNADDLVRVAGELMSVNFNFLVKLLVDSDNTSNVLQMTVSHLPVSALSSYWMDDAVSEYRKYISILLQQAQVANSATVDEQVDTIINLEKIIATIPWPNYIDFIAGPVLSHTHMTFGEATTKYPLTVKGYVTGMFEKAGVPLPDPLQPIIIRAPSYLDGLEKLLKDSRHLSALKTLMKYHYINARRDLLNDQITAAALECQTIDGTSKRPTREKFCVDFVVQQLPNRMGKEYAALVFDSESANVAKDMFSRIEATMKQHVMQTDWLDNATRKKALEKLAKVTKMIGYSEKVEQVDDMSAEDFFGNTESIQRSLVLQQIQKLSKPINRGEWHMAASEADMHYDYDQNRVVVPAGILQPTQFSKTYPAAINYGATAMSMALELFRAFSRDCWYNWSAYGGCWWTEKTAEEYQKRNDCLLDQFSKSFNEEVSNGMVMPVRNFPEASGFALAFEAYQQFMEQSKPQSTTQQLPEMDRNGTVSSKTDMDKLFYVAYAQSWCASPHSTHYMRVNGVIMNDQYFGDLFKCSVGAKMNPKDKCAVW